MGTLESEIVECRESTLSKLAGLIRDEWELAYDDGYYTMSKRDVAISHNKLANLIHITLMIKNEG